MIKKFLYIIVFCLGIWSGSMRAQTTFTLTHNLPYATYHQNMWGPSWQPFTLDFDWDIFHVQWDTSYSWSQIYDIFGEQFGVGFQAGTWGDIGANFSMHGFSTGFININYPVKTHLTFPNPLTFDHGESVTINSNYEVQSGWMLDSHYPSVGTTTLWLDFGLGANIDLIVCAMNCDTIPVIPPINIPTDSITIFHIDSTGYCVYPVYDSTAFPPFSIHEDSVLPIIINDWFNIGLTGEITLPYVITTDWLGADQCLYASGDSMYLHLNLDIITFLSAVAGLIPPPQGPAIQQALGYLNGSMNIPLGGSTATITWSIITASFYMSSTQQQDFTFCPTIWANLSFPTALSYTETDPAQGNLQISQGVNDTISFAVKNDLHITYPCSGYDTLPIGIRYTLTNDFTNHTWDSIAFGFQFAALTFSIHIPTMFMAIPPTEIPDFCLPSIDSSSLTSSSTSSEICMPGFITPGVTTSSVNPKDIQDYDFNIGPLFQDSIPLGYLPFTWYNNTWNMEGFTPADTTVAPTQIIPNPELESTVNSAGVMCFGDSTGTIVITAINGSFPYTFSYPNGIVHTHLSPIDSAHVIAGTYTVTVSDSWGCESYGTVTVNNLNPPMSIALTATAVLCHGDSTGSINSTVSGGVQGYTYQWSPSGQTIANPSNLWASIYVVTVFDAIGCDIIDSIVVSEPLAPLGISDTHGDVSCNGGSNGNINISVIGGTIPYSYNWSNGSLTEDISGLTAGTYAITITDAHACIDTHIVAITQPSQLQIQINPQDVSCYHMNDGIVDITVTGGTPTYSYIWSNGATTEDISGLVSGSYIVSVSDAMGCLKTAFVAIAEPTAPVIASYTVENVRCKDGNNGAIDMTVTGGTSPYNYLWNNSSTTQDLSGLLAGTYIITVSDLHLCDTIITIQITEPLLVLTTSITASDVLCYGGNTGSVNIEPTGGTIPYNFLWNNGFVSEDIHQLTTGIYTVTITDANLCTTTATTFVNQPQKITLIPSADQWICYGQSITLSVAYFEGGIPPYSYVWSNGVIADSINITPSESGVYSIYIQDANGCKSSSSTIKVSVDNALSLNLSAEKDSICPGVPDKLYAEISGGGGTPYTLYLNDSVFGPPPLIINPNISQYHSAYVYDRCHFDSIRDSVYIYTYPLPPLQMKYDVNSGCQPLTVHFIESSPNNGQTYLWDFDTGDFENLSFLKNPTHTFYNAVVYHVKLRVTSNDGCPRESDTLIITVYPKPDARFTHSPDVVAITNPVVNFTNLSNGFTSHLWNFGDSQTSTEMNPEHYYPNFGTYKAELYVKTSHGCLDTAYQNISVESDITFYAPTAFSPDNDGKNEVFKVFSKGFLPESFSLYIYDRWGEPVFKSTNIENGWNGTVNNSGKLCPPGVYVWFVIFKDSSEDLIQKVGSFTLIR